MNNCAPQLELIFAQKLRIPNQCFIISFFFFVTKNSFTALFLLGDTNQPFVDDSKLSAVRLKLEEKRRHIEKEKRRLESQMSKQLQKVGKAAFLQAINKRVRI